MVESQKLLLELSKMRTEAQKLSLVEKPDDAQKERITELRSTVLPDLETKWQAAVIAEDKPIETKVDGESNERGRLLKRSSLTSMIDHNLFQRGDAKLVEEVRAATKIEEGQVPIDFLLDDPSNSPLSGYVDEDPEVRTASAPTGNVIQPRPWLDYLFPGSSTAYLGVAGETVQPGQVSFPKITGKTTAYRVTGVTAITESDPTTGSTNLDPGRIGVTTSYKRLDSHRWPGYEEALRLHVRSALSDATDLMVLKAATIGFETSSLLTTVSASAAFDHAAFLNLVGGGIDGRYANSVADVRTLTRPEAYIQGLNSVNSGSGESAIESLQRLSAGFRVSANLTAEASNKVLAIQALGRGRKNAVLALWSGLETTLDPYSSAAEGIIKLTITQFSDFRIVDAGGFRRAEIQVA